ncbi:MAG: EAL domain-containing protein [Sphaerotilus sp.]|nr:EAL domain-containing protein [Sphaerotilus sp.]
MKSSRQLCDFVSSGCQLTRLLEGVGESIVHVDAQWVVRYCNEVYLRGLGLRAEQVIGKTPFDYHPGFRRSIFFETIEACRRDGQPRMAIGYSTAVQRWLMVRVYPHEGGMMSLANDATESVVRQFQLAQEALRDPLTRVGNQRAMEQDIVALLDRSSSFSLVLFSLRRFNTINDSLGHSQGDLALMEIASRLQSLTRDAEHLYRLNGVEFVLLTPATDVALHERIDALAARLGETVTMRGQHFRLGGAFGVVAVPDHGDSPDVLLRRAALALRCAKRSSGEQVVHFDDRLETAGRLRAALEGDFRAALQRHGDSDGLALALQPKGRLKDGHVVGAEALIRWRHAERGPLSPADFLPMAQECGLMVELDRWVLDEALRLQRNLMNLGHQVPVSINLSVEGLADVQLAGNVSAALLRWGVPASLLEIEVPEGALMRDVEISGRVLAELSALGVRISIDDFGTGYSSFAYLARFPVSTLKIDRSFVRDMCTKAASKTIVRSMVSLAHALSMDVVAEGAETDEEMAMLRRMHCDMVQGFGYGRPLPFDTFVSFVSQRTGGSVSTNGRVSDSAPSPFVI